MSTHAATQINTGQVAQVLRSAPSMRSDAPRSPTRSLVRTSSGFHTRRRGRAVDSQVRVGGEFTRIATGPASSLRQTTAALALGSLAHSTCPQGVDLVVDDTDDLSQVLSHSISPSHNPKICPSPQPVSFGPPCTRRQIDAARRRLPDLASQGLCLGPTASHVHPSDIWGPGDIWGPACLGLNPTMCAEASAPILSR